MICRRSIGEPLSVMSFASFAKVCRKKFDEDNEGRSDQHVAMSIGCANCATGKAIKSGALVSLPDNVRLIKREEVTMTAGQELQMPAGIDRGKLQTAIGKGLVITSASLSDLRELWIHPAMTAKKMGGLCPNCRRRVRGGAAGVCAYCYQATRLHTGKKLFSALIEIADRFRSLASDDPVVTDDPGGPCAASVEGVVSPAHENEEADKTPPAQEPAPASFFAMELVREIAAPGLIRDVISAHGDRIPVANGYSPLATILDEALAQAQSGKGKDRHADGKPFLDQPIMIESRSVGLGFPAGQARKKILEAVRCCDDHPIRAIADLLGAINYTAALVIAIRERQPQDVHSEVAA